MKKNNNLFIFLVGILFLLAAFGNLSAGDAVMSRGRAITFTDPPGAVLAGTYYPGTVNAGVMLLEGFSADQVMLRSIAVTFAQAGYHVFTFDFSGQGQSPGSLGFDNAATDRLAFQAQSAMQEFLLQSKLEAGQIVWLGHSLGARVALESSVIGKLRPSGLILMGAQVNLGSNAQSEFFTGTSDSDLAWVKSLGPQNPPIPIQLISGDWDDILTVDGGTRLMRALCASPDPTCPTRTWLLLDRLVHNYEVFSPRAIAAAQQWANTQLNPLVVSNPTAQTAQMRLVWWGAALLGVTLALTGLRGLVLKRYPETGLHPAFSITRPVRYVWLKLVLWLAALPVAGALMFLFMLLPLGNPVFNLIYVGFIGGYGLLMLVLYLTGRAPSTRGRLGAVFTRPTTDKKRWLWAALFNIGLFACVILFYRSGQGLVPPVGERIIWTLIFTPLTALGFWLGAVEDAALARSFPTRGNLRLAAFLVGLFPFFLRFILMAVLGSTSGMLGAGTGLLVLFIILVQGEITRHLLAEGWTAAILQSILLYIAVMPQSVLFTPLFGG